MDSIKQLGGRFRFFFFSSRGRGRGSLRRREGEGGSGFFIESPKGGNLQGRGAEGREGLCGKLEHLGGGGGQNIFFGAEMSTKTTLWTLCRLPNQTKISSRMVAVNLLMLPIQERIWPIDLLHFLPG